MVTDRDRELLEILTRLNKMITTFSMDLIMRRVDREAHIMMALLLLNAARPAGHNSGSPGRVDRLDGDSTARPAMAAPAVRNRLGPSGDELSPEPTKSFTEETLVPGKPGSYYPDYVRFALPLPLPVR